MSDTRSFWVGATIEGPPEAFGITAPIKLSFPGWPCQFAGRTAQRVGPAAASLRCAAETSRCMYLCGLPFQFSPFPRWKGDVPSVFRVVNAGTHWRLTDRRSRRRWVHEFRPSAESPYGAWRTR